MKASVVCIVEHGKDVRKRRMRSNFEEAMKSIETKIFNQEIGHSFDDYISVSSDGLYVIKITASAKAWWQHITSPRLFLKKDSLTVRLDGEDSVLVNAKKKLHADDLWNGNILKGYEVTPYILASLKKGRHTLSFVAHGKPFLGTVSIFQIADNTFSLANLTPLKRDRIPWLTFLFHKTVIVSNISITARAEKRKSDDDDLQIHIDDTIEKNETPRAHRDWLWCGKVLKGDVKTFARSFSRERAPKRVDLVADGTPVIDRLSFTLGIDGMNRIPTVDDPRWTGNFRDDSDQIILARAIFGEGRSLPKQGRIAIGWVIRNRIGYAQWGNTYHDVILYPRHFSAFNARDPNRLVVENPASNKVEQKTWREIDTIARGIIQGTIPDPTQGANHYYSTFINSPKWTRARGAKLTLRVENTLFYFVPPQGKRAILPALCISLLFLIFSYGVVASTWVEPLNVNVEKSKHFHEHIADDSVAVYYGCGTECEGVRVFNERTGRQNAEFNYGVGYQWSADKKYVVAVHSAAGYGFTVGDMFGDELLIYTEPAEKYFDSLPVTQWAPHGERLAVLVQNDEEWYDLFVLWGFEKMMRVTSVRIPFIPDAVIAWDPSGRVVSIQGIPVLEIDESGYGHHLLSE